MNEQGCHMEMNKKEFSFSWPKSVSVCIQYLVLYETELRVGHWDFEVSKLSKKLLECSDERSRIIK